jgi:hypothetical protein
MITPSLLRRAESPSPVKYGVNVEANPRSALDSENAGSARKPEASDPCFSVTLVPPLRNRKAVSLVFCLTACFAISVCLALRAPNSPPRVRMEITGCVLTNDTFIITAIATNLGPTALEYIGFPPQSEIQWRSDGDWRSEPQGCLSQSASVGTLFSKASLNYAFSIPSSARQCRAGCIFETLGPRGTVAAKLLHSGYWNRLYPASAWLCNLLPYGKPSGVEFWSEEFTIAP